MESQTSSRPTFIPLPPSPFRPLSYANSPNSIPQDDPLQSSPSISPNLTFYTAPSTPLPETPNDVNPSTPGSPPPLPVLHISIPTQGHSSPSQLAFGHPSPSFFPSPQTSLASDPSPAASPVNIAQESFPDPAELPVDMFFDDESLSTLERIYLYSRSKASYHRVFIANVLPEWLRQITPQEAVEYVLPLLNTLAMDEDEMVKEAFSSQLMAIMWWFLIHCQLVSEESVNEDDMNSPGFHDHESIPSISVQVFTPILGTLLLSHNGIVGGAARQAVVQLLERIKRLDSVEADVPSRSSIDIATDVSRMGLGGVIGEIDPRTVERRQSTHMHTDNLDVGLFGKTERALFEKEILYQVVIGMGRLDAEGETETSDDDSQYDDALEEERPPQQIRDVSVGPATLTSRYGHESQGDFDAPVIVADISERDDDDGSLGPGRDFRISHQGKATPDDDSRTRKHDASFNPYFPSSPNSYMFSRPVTTYNSSPASVGSPDSTGSTPGSTSGTSASSFDDDPSFSPLDCSLSPYYPSQVPSSATVTNISSLSTDKMSTTPFSTSVQVARQQDRAQQHRDSVAMTSVSPAEAHSGILDTNRIVQTSITVDANQCQDRSVNDSDNTHHEEYEADQAAVGRLSSMSLMAAVAASGCFDDATQRAFVNEVERVSHDAIYWVRREACLALGALAKVVPEELVILTLMPLYRSLAVDSIDHVRHSSLYALPAILSRLSPRQRRSLALEVLVPMSMDESSEVRSGVLETLGEVIYTFRSRGPPVVQSVPVAAATHHDDALLPSPPEQLLRMFLGRAQDRRKLDGQHTQAPTQERVTASSSWSDVEEEWMKKGPSPIGSTCSREEALRAFYEDPSRPLICAFNIPAVALALGRDRWASELREVYLLLVKHDSPAVQRTLAASLGELGKVIGPEFAHKDLLGVWRTAVRNDEGEVRMKAVEAFETYFGVMERAGQRELLTDLLIIWEQGFLKGWREREKVAGCLGGVAQTSKGPELSALIARLEVLSLQDPVNAVREAGIDAFRILWLKFDKHQDAFGVLKKELHTLAKSDKSRHRMTLVTFYLIAALGC
ncbi:ARM repeat-containing protein [Marasmius fiardii PR-910]|nr:ARM repeat-containing protein [Marasmius fiardii PR-910]